MRYAVAAVVHGPPQNRTSGRSGVQARASRTIRSLPGVRAKAVSAIAPPSGRSSAAAAPGTGAGTRSRFMPLAPRGLVQVRRLRQAAGVRELVPGPPLPHVAGHHVAPQLRPADARLRPQVTGVRHVEPPVVVVHDRAVRGHPPDEHRPVADLVRRRHGPRGRPPPGHGEEHGGEAERAGRHRGTLPDGPAPVPAATRPRLDAVGRCWTLLRNHGSPTRSVSEAPRRSRGGLRTRRRAAPGAASLTLRVGLETASQPAAR